MRKTKAVEVNRATYVVRELTPIEIDALFDQSRQKEQSTIDGILDVHCLDTILLGAMLGVDPPRCGEIIGGLTTSEYMPIIEAAKELNPDFFAMARRRLEYAGQLAEANKIIANLCGNVLPSSLPTDTPTPPTTA